MSMGVYIRGIEMPRNCKECVCINDEYFYCQAVGRQPQYENVIPRRPYWCPLVAVPPHGDLIDKKNLIKDLQRRWNVSDDQDFCDKEVWHALDEAPTIIEAEEGD